MNAEPECQFPEGCHRVVTCDPGCAVGSRLLAERLAAARDTVTIPLVAFDQLVKVAMHVSLGRSAAFNQRHPYPDATARYGLGALDEAGLLDGYRQRHPEDGAS
ncbi:MAG TPA: hypothetical protein VGL02_23395 [Streptomyces sp.]